MTTIKEKDFIELTYTGTIKEDNIVFDTTDEKIAKDNNIYNEQMNYKPIIICIGQGQLIKGLDHQLIGKEVGKEYTFEIPPEQGFGKKSAKLLKMIPLSVFRKQNIQPMTGLQVNIDGIVGIIRTVTGGRTIVDFNHPLASKNLLYNVKLNKTITDDKDKISAFILLELGLETKKIEINQGNAKVFIKKESLDTIKDKKDKVSNKIVELIDTVKGVEFVADVKSSENKKEHKKDKQETEIKENKTETKEQENKEKQETKK
tara:strand:+ start:31286 stop:32065 length:780 start_codon:yes stop_codon:yes gene_type:complete